MGVRTGLRRFLRKWHVWLGWLVGVPFLLWTLSGFVMVLKPIEEVRGSHLLEPASPVRLSGQPTSPVLPEGMSLDRLELLSRATGPVWIARTPGGETFRFSAEDGRTLPPYSPAQAVAEVEARYVGEGQLDGVTRIDADDPPMDWRRPVEAYAVQYDNGDRFYVEVETGQVAATRTGWWRIFDFFWGLHIMDLQTREHISNWWIRIFAILGVAASLMALVLLPLASKRKKKRSRA